MFDVNVMAAVCDRHGADFRSTSPESMVAVADNVRSGALPINGLRHREGSTSGWFIWAGTELSDADDYFKPIHAVHLVDRCPEVVRLLGLGAGWRFLLAGEYEDVWFDAALLADEV